MLNSSVAAETLPPQRLLLVEGLEVDFDGYKALRRLDFTVSERELRFLIGPNGAGKTTLLDVICGKVKPSEGKVVFKDRYDLAKHQEHQIAELGIGRKFQAPSIFATLTVLENLTLALRQKHGLLRVLFAKPSTEQRDRLISGLSTIGLRDKAKLQAGSLSHGEKQWLEIGMLLMQEPELLLLDEPAAGMTDEETEKTGELLDRIARKQTVLVVEHDMEFVRRFAHKVSVLHEGSLLKEGTMEDIQADEQVAEVYLGRRGERDAHH